MGKTAIIYGILLALGAFLLQWLEYQYAIRLFSTETYIVVLAILFTGIGIWFGTRLSKPRDPAEFERNEQAIRSLGLTGRELQVLVLLAEGESNRGIAKRLSVSTSTIKTHLVNVYQKLQVARRTQAIQRARSLHIIP